ncbi:MAG: hypothetical protein GF392_05215, partial [Candidatus Omnitrophica bacterium]|nr:hypothetical protein [Candidatus Omnitrophota bacterium]
NRSFVEKAPAEVVEKEKARKIRFERELSTLKDNLSALA